MRLNTNTAKSRLNKKHYQKELFKYKLKHWFESMNTLRLANYMDVGLTEVKEDGVIECAMDRYADSLFEYLEKNKTMPLIVCGKNSDEKDLFDLEIGIFDYAGICLDMETQETFQGGIIIAATKEFWLLENGDFVIIQCIRYEGSDGFVEYRNLDHNLDDFYDTGIDVEEFLFYLESIE